jgi:hypothetical protein
MNPWVKFSLQGGEVHWVRQLLLGAGRGCMPSTTPLNGAVSLRPLPDLDNGVFVSQNSISPPKAESSGTSAAHGAAVRPRLGRRIICLVVWSNQPY